MLCFHTRLEAHLAARNVHRYYAIAVCTDLLGWYTVELSWGRVGARHGQRKVVAAATEAEALALADRALHRRQGSVKRCGAEYRSVAVAAGKPAR